MHPIIDITAHYKSKRSLDTHDLSVPKKERAAFFRLEYRGRPKCRWGFLAVPTLHGPHPAGSLPWGGSHPCRWGPPPLGREPPHLRQEQPLEREPPPLGQEQPPRGRKPPSIGQDRPPRGWERGCSAGLTCSDEDTFGALVFILLKRVKYSANVCGLTPKKVGSDPTHFFPCAFTSWCMSGAIYQTKHDSTDRNIHTHMIMQKWAPHGVM